MAVWEKLFRRVNWENEPSVATPLAEDYLNRSDLALDQIDDRVLELNNRTNNLEGYETRVALLEEQARESQENASQSEANAKESEDNSLIYRNLSESWAVGTPTGLREDETTNNSKYWSEQSQAIKDSAETEIIAVKNSSLSEISTAKTNAITDIVSYGKEAESYAHGGTGTRTDEDIDNAEYYYEQCKAAAEGITGALIPMGTLAFEDVPPIETLAMGYMYNISNDFVTTDDFVQGAGYQETLGSNIYVLMHEGVKKFDILAGTPVTGVKGEKETVYRKGNVSLSPENIGAIPIEQSEFTSNDEEEPTSSTAIEVVQSNEALPTFFNKITKLFKNVRWLLGKLGDTSRIPTIDDGTVSGTLSKLNTNLKAIYPVGAIYLSVNNVNPSTFIGGTWEAFGASDTYLRLGGSESGGSNSVSIKLDKNQIPSLGTNSIDVNHTHVLTSHGHGFTNPTIRTSGGHSHTISTYYLNNRSTTSGNRRGWGAPSENNGVATVSVISSDSGTHSHDYSANGSVGDSGDLTTNQVVNGLGHHHSFTNNNQQNVNINVTPKYVQVYAWKRTA